MYALVRSRSAAFSLVEVLVVIAIVSALIALLLPALAKARESASAVHCSSNLRQIQLASSMYTGDNQERIIPASIYSVPGINAWTPIGWVTAQTTVSLGLNNGHYFPGRFPALTRCPSSPLEPDDVQVPTIYAANARVSIQNIRHPNAAVAATRGPVVLSEVKLAPSRVIAFFDAGKDRSNITISPAYPFAPGEISDTAYYVTAAVGRMGYWHAGDSANFVALDGHGTTARLTDTTAPAANHSWWRNFEKTRITFDFTE